MSRVEFIGLANLFASHDDAPAETADDVRGAFGRVLDDARAACEACPFRRDSIGPRVCPADQAIRKHLPKKAVEI